MRIAIIIFDITKMAGTERAACNLANLLASHDIYEPFIVSIGSNCGAPKYEISPRISIHHMGLNVSPQRIGRLIMYGAVFKGIKKFCIDKKIDVVLGTNHSINMILPFLSVSGLKVIGCEHISYFAVSLLSRLLRRIVYRFLDAVVVLTASEAKYFRTSQKHVEVIPNSLSFLPKKYANLNTKIILAIGRLTHQKGFDMLIKAINIIKNECTNWKVKVIGDGEEKDGLKKQIENLGLSNIIEIYPPTTEIEKEYLNASVFVMSSRYEGLPMVLIEAKSFGIPIVSFDCHTGPRDVIENNQDGLLVERNNIKGLSEAILGLMTNPQKRSEFGIAARKNADRYNPQNIYILWDSLFKGINLQNAK